MIHEYAKLSGLCDSWSLHAPIPCLHARQLQGNTVRSYTQGEVSIKQLSIFGSADRYIDDPNLVYGAEAAAGKREGS
jgi:hypothetical protein